MGVRHSTKGNSKKRHYISSLSQFFVIFLLYQASKIENSISSILTPLVRLYFTTFSYDPTSSMDSTYCWQCQQIGVVPHPLLLRHFCDSTNPVLVLGGRNDDVDPPVRDADLVASSLVLRSLSRTNRLPSVRLDLSGELITCDGLRTIAAVLQVGSLPLRSLLLRRSHVADNGAAALGAVLSSSQLMELDLGECAITDVGLRYLMRGPQVHGAPPCLSVLLLDGNATGDAGTIEVISFLERERTTLANLSVQPALPRFLSQEVEAALQVQQLRLGFFGKKPWQRFGNRES